VSGTILMMLAIAMLAVTVADMFKLFA